MPKGWPSSVAPAPGAITDVNLIQYLGVACGPLNPVDTDVVDRAVRLLGVIYGSQAQQLQQVAGTFELTTQDTGLNTNPERWLQDNHWSTPAEVSIAAAGAPGEQNFGGAVGVGVVRRIREVSIRNAGSNATVVTLYDATAGNILLTIDVPAATTIVWSSQDGRDVAATLQPVIRTSDVTGGSTLVSGAGVEA